MGNSERNIGRSSRRVCKNKIGVNIVETFQSEKTGIDNQKFKFDKMFAFKKTLDETRKNLNGCRK